MKQGPALVSDWALDSGNGTRQGAHPVVLVLRMALGQGAAAPRTAADWWAAYRLAARERCLGIIWLRSGHLIRSQAPVELVQEWRTAIVRQYDRAEALLCHAGRTTSRLLGAGIPCVILKGAPLAAQLYGDPLVRPMDDIDLLVPRAHWGRAAQVLEGEGWSKEQGKRGWSEIYRFTDGGETFRLDIQSSLLVDHLDHLPELRGTVGHWRWRECALPTYVGPEVAVFLATHLLKHQLPPLLWLIDFYTYWGTMSANDRNDARRVATASRAHRYLAWAVRRAGLLFEASRGAAEAVQKLGFYRSFRQDDYGMIRLVGLAASVSDIFAVLGAWAWPRPLRYDWTAFRHMWRRRVGKRMSQVLTARRLYLDPRHQSDLRIADAAREKHAVRWSVS